ncbi:MAG: hypothetical protein QM497_06205 [Sulfurimonas sp.]
MKELDKNIPMICGIDTLHYFAETNENYDNLFLDILDQIEDKKAMFERKEIEFKNSDISIELEKITLQYLNKAEGFYWFKDINEFFRVGFKDEQTNKGLHNIRVQLQGIGLYTIGLKALITFINDNLLKDIATGFYPITRADINCFINHSFSFIDKTMFASRKKKYIDISSIGSANKTQTIYVGKKPFMLRLYDKKLELSKSSKKDMMYEYFANNGLDTKKEIFNVEFEMLRTHLRAYDITTLKDLLANANNLFKKAMEDIRLIDISTITQKDTKNNSKSRAKTLPIWDYIKDNFSIDTFLQNNFPIKRLKRKEYVYDADRFIEELNKLIKKAKIHNVYINSKFISAITQNYLDKEEVEKEKYIQSQQPKIDYIPVEVIGDSKEHRFLKSGKVITPVKTIPFKQLSNSILEKEIVDLENALYFGDINKSDVSKKLSIAYEEREKREDKLCL